MLRRVQSTGDLSTYSMHSSLRSSAHAMAEGKAQGTMDDGVYRIGARTRKSVQQSCVRVVLSNCMFHP